MPRASKASIPRSTSPLPAWPGLHFVGIDENGMGPRLGPLVVTSVLARARPEGAKIATTRPRGALAKRIGDSKKLVAFDDSALGEAWARALLSRAARAIETTTAPPLTPTDLLATLSLDPGDVLRERCPGHHVDLCWGDAGESFASDDAAVVACAKDLDRLATRGLDILRVRVAIVCTRRLNDAVTAGLSRFDVDLHTMERLTLAARADSGDDVHALCGKVGGFDFYGDRFGPLAGRLHVVLGEGRARSDYQFPGVGRLSFLRDAEDDHILIGLASLVGKWVRDHLMRRIVRYHRAHVPDLPEASGYHDPVSTRFISATRLVRKKLEIEPRCFERNAIGNPTASKKTKASARTARP